MPPGHTATDRLEGLSVQPVGGAEVFEVVAPGDKLIAHLLELAQDSLVRIRFHADKALGQVGRA